MKASLPQIKNVSIQAQTLDTLRDAILTGELPPGQTLTETDLSRQLGVSRAPIREALRILNSEGLVETVPYHGTKVRQLLKADIVELYSMRIILETFAVEQIIAASDPEHIDILMSFYDRMVTAGKKNDLKVINEIDREFHDTLIAMSGHSLLQSMWQMVAMRVRQVMALRNRQNTDLTQIARNHLPLIEAVRDGDVAEAKELLGKHISSAGDLIVEDWIASNGEGGDDV